MQRIGARRAWIGVWAGILSLGLLLSDPLVADFRGPAYDPMVQAVLASGKRIPPPGIARPAWDDLVQCTGITPVQGKDFESIRWVQLLTAGFDRLERLGLPRRVTVSTIGDAGVHRIAPPRADEVAIGDDPDQRLIVEHRQLIDAVRIVHLERGGRKGPAAEEQVTIDFAFATVVTIAPVRRGEPFTRDNLWVKRPGTGPLLAERYEDLLGRVASRDIPADTHISLDDVIALGRR